MRTSDIRVPHAGQIGRAIIVGGLAITVVTISVSTQNKQD